MRRAELLLLTALLTGCGRDRSSDPSSRAPDAARSPEAGVPVQVASVVKATFGEVISSPGKTAAMSQQKVRAPFAGTLVELSVVDGDRVKRGATVGTIVSRDSEAALSGAREMAREAKSPAEKEDAERALSLAEQALVRAPISATAAGTVLAHAAARGDRVSEDQEILTIADEASIVFLADVAQSDLTRIRPGQTAEVELAGRPQPLRATVHDVLPGANAADFTVPVRLDLPGLSSVPPVGLFGTARVTVGEHRKAVLVPEGALVRDDVTGITRIVLVRDGHARWIDVTVGLREAKGVEITAPALDSGQMVVVSGQIGLPEGAAVAPHP